jgi:hypothetical protein
MTNSAIRGLQGISAPLIVSDFLPVVSLHMHLGSRKSKAAILGRHAGTALVGLAHGVRQNQFVLERVVSRPSTARRNSQPLPVGSSSSPLQ